MINKLLIKPFFFNTIKLLTFACFILFIIIGFSAYSNNPSFLKYLRNFNLSTLIIWSYWWPLIIVISVFFGRIWCMVCPMELVTSLFSIIGLKMKRPAFIKKGWLITLLYSIILFIGISGFAIHRNPSYLSIYLLILLSLAMAIGYLFKKNTFCKHVCPVGFLLKLYSRFSFFNFGVKNSQGCKQCTDKSCISNKLLYNFENKSCGVEVYPAGDNTSDCVLCGGCTKSCKNFQTEIKDYRPNPALFKTNPLNNIQLTASVNMAEAVFMLIICGFVVYEILSEWSVTKAILMYFPSIISEQFSIENPIAKGLIKSTCLFLILPIIIWGISFFITKLAKTKVSFVLFVRNFSIVFLPIMASAHICKALLKGTSRIPYFQHIFSDLTGMENTQLYLNKTITLFQIPIIIYHLLTILTLVIMVAGFIVSIKILKRIQMNNWAFYAIPTMYCLIFIVTIIWWRVF